MPLDQLRALVVAVIEAEARSSPATAVATVQSLIRRLQVTI
jgi:hypothetical protein